MMHIEILDIVAGLLAAACGWMIGDILAAPTYPADYDRPKYKQKDTTAKQ